jgi:hypothetical protein
MGIREGGSCMGIREVNCKGMPIRGGSGMHGNEGGGWMGWLHAWE